MTSVTQAFNWGDESICLIVGVLGIWFSYFALWHERNPLNAKASLPPLRVRAAGAAASVAVLGAALILPGADMVHHKVSIDGIVGAIIALIGLIICLFAFVAMLLCWSGKIPKYLLPPSQRGQ
ncbi:MAG: hypothetical protein WCF25_12200 [Acidimicrobiales bacterium]